LALGVAGFGRPLLAQDTLATRARQLAAAGDFRQAASAWRLVLEARPNDRSALAGLVDALDASGEWRTAIAPLDKLLELGASEPIRLRQRGCYAAWSGDRPRGIELLRKAVALAPKDPASLAALGEVLSWDPAGRREAGAKFRAALALDPENVTAQVGLANLAAWSGDARRALAGYDRVLRSHPDDPNALKGQGSAFNQLGYYSRARGPLEAAHQLAPNDPVTRNELARAQRATASSAEMSGLGRRRQNQLDLYQVSARASGAIGSLQLFAGYTRSQYRNSAPRFSADGFGGGVRFADRGVTLLASARMSSLEGLSQKQWDGSASLGVRLFGGAALELTGSRSPVEESRRSIVGELDGGELRGAVHANLARATLVLDDFPGPFDADASVLAARYTGIGLEANQRLGVEARAGIVLHHSQPWVRIGYGFSATEFDYNADLAVAGIPTRRGGYFSPAAWWSHQGILQFSQRIGSRIEWNADGRLGRQWVRQLDGESADSRNAAIANTSLTLRLTPMFELETRFLYLNAFDAFELKELSAALKLYLP
jgi:tetratricopeptide (TPR) repeat protein